MTIKIFGQLNDIIGGNVIEVENIADTDELVEQLEGKYPSLVNSKYRVAVNRKIIELNTALQQDAEVALLPPFSGG